jgi:hypothetical protein
VYLTLERLHHEDWATVQTEGDDELVDDVEVTEGPTESDMMEVPAVASEGGDNVWVVENNQDEAYGGDDTLMVNVGDGAGKGNLFLLSVCGNFPIGADEEFAARGVPPPSKRFEVVQKVVGQVSAYANVGGGEGVDMNGEGVVDFTLDGDGDLCMNAGNADSMQ